MASNFPAEVLHPFSGIIRRREDREQMQSSNKNIVRVKDGDMSTGTMSQRKRPVSREKDALSTKSRLNLETDGAGDESIAANAPATVPIEVLDTVFEFLDGNGLLSCEAVSYRWRLATDRTHLWKRACLAAFPHLGNTNFETAHAYCSAYEGDWRETFLDGNRENRSAVVDWDMEAVADADGNPEESERRYFPPFKLGGYSFSLLADPGGNPRALIQAQPAGEPRMEKGLSVYLTVAFQDEQPGAPPWGGLGVGLHQYPPPPLCLGPCHPWGEEDGEREEDAAAGASQEGTDRASDRGHGRNLLNCTGGNKAKGRECLPAARARVCRDPHGLRRKRRRFRRREGRVKCVSTAGDPATIARECCAAFSLAAVDKDGHKEIMWVSSMEGDRFFPGRRSWGVHCLLPTSIIQNPEKGFLKNGSLTVRLRLRLLFLIVHVYTTGDLASHRGFGVVPVRGQDRSFHFSGGSLREGGGQEGEYPSPGPLSCLTFEVLRCTTLEEMEIKIAQALNLTSTQDLRLWVITQPLTDGPLAPWHLLSGEHMSSKLVDGQNSPSLLRLLRDKFLDETCRVRLWAEQRDDGGFWETEVSHPRWELPIAYADGTWRFAARPTSRETFAGVRLACTAGMPPWLMRSPMRWGSEGYPKDWVSAFAPDAVGSAPGHANNSAVSGLVEEASAQAGLPSDENEDGPAANSAGDESSADMPPPQENRILVFLKAIGLRREEENFCGDDSGVERPAYLTHVVLRGRSPLRTLFELVADLMKDGTAPEELGAYVEDLPCTWQGGAARGFLKQTTPGLSRGATAEPYSCSRRERNRPLEDKGRDFATGGPGAGRSKRSKATPPKRFFACPPPEKMIPPQESFTPWMKELGAGAAVDVNGKGFSGGEVGDVAAPTVSAESYRRQANQHLTLEGAGVAGGASICFFRAGQESEGEAMVRRTYTAMVDGLVEDMRKLLRGEGPLGRVHLIKLQEVVELCESMGYQGFRARIAHDQQRHVNPRKTLEYIARGRHLAFICDSCGTQDFTGPRYHCLRCPDYDLCRQCHNRDEPVPQHRFLFTDGHWKREGGFHGHTKSHDLEEIWPVPTESCDWRRWHNLQAVA